MEKRPTLLRILFSCIVTVLTLFGYQATSFGKEYYIKNVVITAELLPDGDVRYVEHRTYAFDGSFSEATYVLPLRGFDRIKEISVGENSWAYTTDLSKEPGTFLINDGNSEIEIKWFYRAKDETRTFEVSFTLEGAIIVGPDYSEFFWTYLSNDWGRNTENLAVEFIIPAQVRRESPRLWVSGAIQKVIIQPSYDGFTLQSTEPIQRRERVSVRTVFPTNVLAQPIITDPSFSLESILADEEQRRIQAEIDAVKRAEYREIGRYVGVLIIVLSVVIWITMYRKYGERAQLLQKPDDVLYAVPSDLPPAIVGWLMTSTVNTNHLVATLFDVSRRGYFILREREPEKGFLKSKNPVIHLESTKKEPDEELREYEKELVVFLRERIETISTDMNKIFGTSPNIVSKWYHKWLSSVKKEAKEYNFIDSVSTHKMSFAMGYQGALFVGSIVLAIIFKAPELIAAVIVTLLFMLISIGIQKRTPEGEMAFLKWKAYRKGLSMANTRTLDQSTPELHFIYATAFGMNGKRLESLLEDLSLDDNMLIWMSMSTNPAIGVRSISATITNVTTAVASSTASFSGGGAAGGAAGGGAGGGAS
jgi:uncharacterized membrane protein